MRKPCTTYHQNIEANICQSEQIFGRKICNSKVKNWPTPHTTFQQMKKKTRKQLELRLKIISEDCMLQLDFHPAIQMQGQARIISKKVQQQSMRSKEPKVLC